jgi:two-component system NtrC family response regulator
MTDDRPKLLIVEDDAALADQLRWAVQQDYRLELAATRDAALEVLRRFAPDAVLLDLCLPPGNVPEEGLRILEAARSRGCVALVMSGLEEREPALRAIERGAYDFFTKPFDLRELRIVIARALERRALEQENRALRERLRESFRPFGIVGRAPAMREVFDAIERVRDSRVTVALLGASGTGKSLVARAIHAGGARREGPFVVVHCAALPESLLEAELFGHEKGAFTGAAHARLGRFEAASGGTLFLDEIGTLPELVQVKLLRVLEERQVERLGSNVSRSVDVRLVVATNDDLEEKVRRGELRQDFYYRVMVFAIRIPPLAQRLEDVPLLAEHFLHEIGEGRGRPPKRLSAAAIERLSSRPWPGNVRELRNTIETSALLADGETIEAHDIDRLPVRAGAAQQSPGLDGAGLKDAVESFERQVLLEAIRSAGGVKARAAEKLRLDPSQMKYLVRKHGL